MKTLVREIFTTSPLRIWGTLVFFLLSFSNPFPVLLFERPTINLNPIQRENQLVGTTDWQLSNPAAEDNNTFTYPAIQGYAWTTSAQVGDEVQFSVSTTSPSFSADVYRMGWYEGKGGRLMQSIATIQGHAYPLPSPNASTGLIEANWPVAFTLKTNPGWASGMYMVKLTASNGEQSYIPCVLRSSKPRTFAFIHAANTDEAYNFWGGTSLYRNLTHTFQGNRAFKVSFDRPFEQDRGAGLFFWFEYPMVRWLEQHGYDVGYLSDPDLQINPYPLLDYDALLIVGHSEYWSKQMRDALEGAVNKGVNLAVFGANSLYWQIRYESRSSGGQAIPDRIIVCYKSQALDPLYGKENDLVTVKSRASPLNKPEQSLLGSMWAGQFTPRKGGFPWVVADASSWVFAGTGLRDGASLPGLVGYEYDQVNPNYPIPKGVEILAASPVTDDINNKPDMANATLYTATSGARVFNAGTFEWSWGLDSNSSIERFWSPGNTSRHPSLVNKAAQKITANILQNFVHTGNPSQEGALNLQRVIPYAFVTLLLLSLGYCYWVWRKVGASAKGKAEGS
ncbi:MAG: N,N-dimethylformamidase beta subunit family domain-containing protein [Ktedonobacteraceae bacterium]